MFIELKTLVFAAGVLAAGFGVSAQHILYEETFPCPDSPGSVFPISIAGWANDITNNPNRLFHESGTDGAVFAFQGTMDVPISTAFYTTTQLDTGSRGPAFPAIDPEAHRQLVFCVSIRPGVSPDNIQARFAVQMNGANWFAAADALPVPPVHGPFAHYTQNFERTAARWRTLTFNGSSVTIGAGSPGDIAGNITGAGMVFTHTVNNGNYDFDNFRIITDLGRVAITSIANQEATLAWFGLPGVRLQSSTNLSLPFWQDVPKSSGQSNAVVPMTQDQMFFRLAK